MKPAARRRETGIRGRPHRRMAAYAAFVAPAVVFFTLIVLIPFLRAILYSFQDWNGISSEVRWAGTANYRKLASDAAFRQSFWFTLRYVAAASLLVNALGLTLALLLNAGRHMQSLLRTAFFIPFVLGSLIIGFVWQFMFTRLFPEIGAATGWAWFAKNWLSSPHYSFWALVIVSVWHAAGYYMVLYLAALRGVPRSLLEAAEMDGAGRWGRLRHIVLPWIRPAAIAGLFFAVTTGFKSFDLNFALTKGGPYGSTESLALHIYKEAFTHNLYTYAAAKSVLLFIAIATFTLIQVAVMKRKEVEM